MHKNQELCTYLNQTSINIACLKTVLVETIQSCRTVIQILFRVQYQTHCQNVPLHSCIQIWVSSIQSSSDSYVNIHCVYSQQEYRPKCPVKEPSVQEHLPSNNQMPPRMRQEWESTCWFTLAFSPGHSQILSCSHREKLGEGLRAILHHGPEMVDSVL